MLFSADCPLIQGVVIQFVLCFQGLWTECCQVNAMFSPPGQKTLREWIHFQGRQLSKLFYLPSEQQSALKGIKTLGANSFLLE